MSKPMTQNQEALAERREMKQDSFVPSVTADAAPRESANAGAASRYVAPPIWPNGCIKPGSCSKDTSRRCMYARTREQCPHVDRDIGPEIDAERTRRDRVSDGSPQGQDAKRLDPKDDSAVGNAETPDMVRVWDDTQARFVWKHPPPPNLSGFGELVERHYADEDYRRLHRAHCLTEERRAALEAENATLKARIAELEREVAIHKGNADDIYAKWAEERAAKETAEKALAYAMAVVREIAEIPTSDESPGTAPDPTMDELIWAARAVRSTTGDKP